jgi:Cdc6-like AAA superfamily ATPase
LADFVELDIESGATFSLEITIKNDNGTGRNLASHTITSQLRKSYYSSTANNFTISILDTANGIISMGMTAANTANLRAGRYVFDVEMNDTANSTITRIFEGIATVLPNVTR